MSDLHGVSDAIKKATYALESGDDISVLIHLQWAIYKLIDAEVSDGNTRDFQDAVMERLLNAARENEG